MDEDRGKGAAKNIGGKIKESIGKVTGDESTEAEGKRDQGEGTVQEGWGKTKDAARDLGNRDR